MNTFIRATIIAIALSAGAVSAQAGSSYADAVSKGQVLSPNGTSGGNK